MSTMRTWLDKHYALGRAFFTLEDLRADGLTEAAALARLSRALQEGLVFSPTRGLYVVVPAEYRVDKAPPWQWFLDPMMKHLGAHYYVGLLTAAAQHGASPQAAQEVQIVADRQVRPRDAGRQRLVFINSDRARLAPVEISTTPTGQVRVSTPEMTMLDLVTYPDRAAGWGNIVTIINELGRRGSRKGWIDALKTQPAVTDVQRLGFVLDQASSPHVDVLEQWLNQRRYSAVPLVSGFKTEAKADHRWKVIADPGVQAD